MSYISTNVKKLMTRASFWSCAYQVWRSENLKLLNLYQRRIPMSVEPLSPNEKASLPRFSKPTSLSSSPSSKNSSAVQSPVNAAKYKTQICKSFDQTGTCPYNSKCLFAHGAKELRTPTPSSSTRRQSVNAIVVSLHAASRLSSTASSPTAAGPDTKIIATAPRQWSASVSSKEGAPSPKSASNAGEKAIVLYKTELCRSFASTGSCPYGNKCQFAHGDTELRTVQRHKNYKTTKCEKFHSAGHCPFGLRCIFIHDEDERELPNSESFDPEFASAARQRRASQQYEKLQVEQESKELDGEFLKRRFSETEAKDAE